MTSKRNKRRHAYAVNPSFPTSGFSPGIFSSAYTFTLAISQYASVNFSGCCATYAFNCDIFYVNPGLQLKMSLSWNTSGVGKEDVEGFSSLSDAGTASRAKAQILMPAEVHSVT